jgi:hypothetical protein
MNNNNLSKFNIPFASDLWHKFRTVGINEAEAKSLGCQPYAGGVGGSEIGTILGLTKKYRPCTAEIFHYKVGDSVPQQSTNRAMLRGKILEPIVSAIWQLCSGDDDMWVHSFEEYQNGDRETRSRLAVRKARKINAYHVNNQYPWLFSSLDYFAEKGTPGIMDGKIHDEGFPVEIKTVNQNYAKLWQDGIPIYHVLQLNQEMICTNSEYGEIAVLFPDDFSFRIFPFYKDQELCDRIIHWSKAFWDKVLESRIALKKRDKFYAEGKSNDAEHMQSIIDSNEPEPDDGEAYNEYIKECYKQVIPSVPGNAQLFDLCLEDEACRLYAGMIEDKRTGIQNQLMKVLETTGAEEISFDSLGKVTYKANKNKVRSLRYDLKMKPSKSKAEEHFQNLVFNL